MNYFFALLFIVHGLIHTFGFLKAFNILPLSEIRLALSKRAGLLWLVAAVGFLSSGILLIAGSSLWPFPALVTLPLSQYLIWQSWSDAKFGTVLNVLFLFPSIIGFISFFPSQHCQKYSNDREILMRSIHQPEILQESDIRHLPPIVQKYLHFCHVVGKPKVQTFQVHFSGKLRQSPTSGWLTVDVQQYSSLPATARLFYIRASLWGIPFDGLHRYWQDSATMRIDIARMVRVVDAQGDTMTQSETVTFFNDMCLLAPATLIDSRIQWRILDSLTVQATFSTGKHTIEALLSFRPDGALINFLSNDRFLSVDGTSFDRYPWSTPVDDYRLLDGIYLPAVAKAYWHLPEGKYCYAEFLLEDIVYNF